MKKTLSIILAILMIVTTIPFAFAADEIPDFSDAKVLSADADGYLCVDGQKIETQLVAYWNTEYQTIPAGKYRLEGDIETGACAIHTESQQNFIINLNGYTWDLADGSINLKGSISVYDTSAGETGKIVSTRKAITADTTGTNINLYSGTIETTGTGYAVNSARGNNLYGGKIKSNGNAIFYYMDKNITINLDGTVIEAGEGYAQISCSLAANSTPTDAAVDVTDYKGGPLTVAAEIRDTEGKMGIFKGIAMGDAEKYTVNVTCKEGYGCFFEKEEYDEATGEKYIYIAKNAFTQQPSVDNNYTVDFRNPDALFQWYVIEEKNIGTYEAKEDTVVFTYEFKAGDILKVSTDSEIVFVDLRVGNEHLGLENDSKIATIKFDTDASMDILLRGFRAENTVELEFTVITETALGGETEKTLQSPECGKNYLCKATVGENVYTSDTVVGHENIIHVDAKTPTCTEIGWDAYEYCTACDFTTYVEKEALNHKDTLVKVDAKAPTCTEIGWDAYEYCTACDYTTYVEHAIDPNAHDIIIDEAVAADCANTGLTEGQHCSRCNNATIAQEVIPALNHKDTLVKVDAKAPTCTEIGWDAYEYCTACTYTTYVEHAIVPDAHDIIIDKAVAGDCTNAGLTEGQHCSRCNNATIAQEVIPATGEHIDADGDTMCDNGGEQLTCPDCKRPVHTGFIAEIICFFAKTFNLVEFIRNLFAK